MDCGTGVTLQIVGHALLCPTYTVDQVRQHNTQIDVDRDLISGPRLYIKET